VSVDDRLPVIDPHWAITIRAAVVRLDEKLVSDAETLVFVIGAARPGSARLASA
jgi:hypothetical protein